MSGPPTQPIFNGRYRVVRTLARGGMAEVFLGEDLVLDRTVALKVLAGELSLDEGFVERFRREAQAAAGLSHPNIVSVYDWGEADGSYFIVMEYIDGLTLAHRIHAEGAMPPEQAAAIGADIAAALAAAHRQGVVHRDVKPGNVLIGSNGQVKVTDFGIARAARWGTDAQLTQTGIVLGTVAYLSPEQAEGRVADARSDVYSLGVVLYEMATGQAPFRGDNAVAVAYKHAREQPELPSRANPEVPAWLEAVILKALAKDPGQRYADAEDLRSDLSRGEPPASVAAPTVAVAMPPTEMLRPRPPTEVLPPRQQEALVVAPPERSSRAAGVAALAILTALVIGAAIYFAVSRPSSTHGTGPGAPTTTKPASTSSSPTTTKPPASTTTDSTTTTSSTTSTTTPPTSFPGYEIVAGSGASAMYCPTAAPLGAPGQTGTSGSGPPGTTSSAGGQGGAAGCGSNGGAGGAGGPGAPGAAGGAGGAGGNGGCAPATLTAMRAGSYPCNGSGSDGGAGGNGGNAAPTENGGAGGAGGPGGNCENAKGGNGGTGGNASPTAPGGPGGPGQEGGGPSGTTPGVNGQNGANGTNG